MRIANISFTLFLFLSEIVCSSCSSNTKITLDEIKELEKTNLVKFVNSTDYNLCTNLTYIIKPPNSCSSCVNAIYNNFVKDSNEHYVIFLPQGDSMVPFNGVENYFYSVDLFEKSGLSRNYPLSFKLTGELSIQPLIGK